jgi:hypothetical protein
MKILTTIGVISIALILAGGYYVKYRIDDSKIVKVVSAEPKIEKGSGFKYTDLVYIHRDGKSESKSVLDKFQQPLRKIAAKRGCIEMKLTFSDWYPWDKYRGLDGFEEVDCPF